MTEEGLSFAAADSVFIALCYEGQHKSLEHSHFRLLI